MKLNIQPIRPVGLPANLEVLAEAKPRSFIYADKNGRFQEVGIFCKVVEYIKGKIFNGAFGIQDRTSGKVIGDSLVTLLKQNKKCIDQNQLVLISKIAERAHADSPVLKAKISKLAGRLVQLAVVNVLGEAPKISKIVSVSSKTSVEAEHNSEKNETPVAVQQASKSAPDSPGVVSLSSSVSSETEEVNGTATLINQVSDDQVKSGEAADPKQLEDLPEDVTPDEQSITWSQKAAHVGLAALPYVGAIITVAFCAFFFKREEYENVDVIINDTATNQSNTCPANHTVLNAPKYSFIPNIHHPINSTQLAMCPANHTAVSAAKFSSIPFMTQPANVNQSAMCPAQTPFVRTPLIAKAKELIEEDYKARKIVGDQISKWVEQGTDIAKNTLANLHPQATKPECYTTDNNMTIMKPYQPKVEEGYEDIFSVALKKTAPVQELVKNQMNKWVEQGTDIAKNTLANLHPQAAEPAYYTTQDGLTVEPPAPNPVSGGQTLNYVPQFGPSRR